MQDCKVVPLLLFLICGGVSALVRSKRECDIVKELSSSKIARCELMNFAVQVGCECLNPLSKCSGTPARQLSNTLESLCERTDFMEMCMAQPDCKPPGEWPWKCLCTLPNGTTLVYPPVPCWQEDLSIPRVDPLAQVILEEQLGYRSTVPLESTLQQVDFLPTVALFQHDAAEPVNIINVAPQVEVFPPVQESFLPEQSYQSFLQPADGIPNDAIDSPVGIQNMRVEPREGIIPEIHEYREAIAVNPESYSSNLDMDLEPRKNEIFQVVRVPSDRGDMKPQADLNVIGPYSSFKYPPNAEPVPSGSLGAYAEIPGGSRQQLDRIQRSRNAVKQGVIEVSSKADNQSDGEELEVPPGRLSSPEKLDSKPSRLTDLQIKSVTPSFSEDGSKQSRSRRDVVNTQNRLQENAVLLLKSSSTSKDLDQKTLLAERLNLQSEVN